MTFLFQKETLQETANCLIAASTLEKKIDCLHQLPGVKEKAGAFSSWLESEEERYLICSLLAAGQEKALFPEEVMKKTSREKMRHLLSQLSELDSYYQSEGGIVGYQAHIQSHLAQKTAQEPIQISSPPLIKLSEQEKEKAINAAIESLPFFAEVYPVGGAGDRLNFTDNETKKPLPAALFPFCAKTLLEGLIEDVQAKEEIYYRKFQKHITTPIALMTSQEKNNHLHIVSVLEEHNYFGRAKDSFFLFQQPLVPVFSKEGKWLLKEPFCLHRKPGGHGAIWKTMEARGVFSWLEERGRTHLFVRQINNPIAGIDDTALHFIGVGILGNYEWGFCSCDRLVGSSEGMDVLVSCSGKSAISNVEYTEFARQGIQDCPREQGSKISIYPANTNILFAKMDVLRKMSGANPFPGETLNMKTTFSCYDGSEVVGGRLETTMQNIADSYKEHYDGTKPLSRTFCTYHPRDKTISAVKKAYFPGKPLRDTPWEGLYHLMKQRQELLSKCLISAPPLPPIQDFVEYGPSWLFFYHPVLGPLYQHIAQKMRGGNISERSFLQIELFDLFWNAVQISGAVSIKGFSTSACVLENVSLQGPAVDSFGKTPFAKAPENQLIIALSKNSVFVAKNVTITGEIMIQVEEGMMVEAYEIGGKTLFHKTPLKNSPRYEIASTVSILSPKGLL